MPRPVQALALAQFSADMVLACRCIARHGRALDVRLHPGAQGAASSSWRLDITPGLPRSSRAGLVYAILEWNDAPFRVGVPTHACRLWLASRYPDLPLDILPEPLLDAAIEAMATDVADSLQMQGASASIVVTGHGKGRDEVSWPHAWTLAVSALPAPGRSLRGTALVSLETGDAGLARLAHAVSYGRPAPDAVDPDQTPVVLRALLGATTLPLKEFKGSGPGDVILLDRYLVDTNARMWLATVDGQGMQVQARDSQLVIVQGWTHIMNDSINYPFGRLGRVPGSDPGIDPKTRSRSDPADDLAFDSNGNANRDPNRDSNSDPNSDPDIDSGGDFGGGTGGDEGAGTSNESGGGLQGALVDGAVDEHGVTSGGSPAPTAGGRGVTDLLDVDAIPVHLTFDVGERCVKLGVLRAMQVGEVIEQGHPLADGCVCIRANGAVVGWGELVDIDGRAGVRILRLTGGPE